MQSWLWPGPLVFKVWLFCTVLSCFCQKVWVQHTPWACLSWEQTEIPRPNQAYPKYRLLHMRPRRWRHLSFTSLKSYVWLDISQSRGCNSSSLPMHQPWEHWLLLHSSPPSCVWSLLSHLLTAPIFLLQGCCYLFCSGAVRGGWRIREGGSSQAVGLSRANIMGPWQLTKAHYSGTVQPDEQRVSLG